METPDGEDERVKDEDLCFCNPRVGVHPAGDDSGIQLLKGPNEMNPADFENHFVNRIPYSASCPYSVAGKRPNTQHRTSPDGRKIPLLAVDYAFDNEKASDDVLPCLGAYVKPRKIIFLLRDGRQRIRSRDH